MSGTLNENIKNFRKFKGITQEALAAKIGKSKNVVSNWERGDNSPDVDCIEKICQFLGVTPNQLFGWDKYPEYERYLEIVNENAEKLTKLIEKKNNLDREIANLKRKMFFEEEKWSDD